jgi:predicted DNA-binding protein
MLGIRLEPQVETDLESYARETGRSKSAIVRDLIARHLEAHSIDEQMRRAAIVAGEPDMQDDPMPADLTVWDD